eukprot:TRINITY_DN3207_c0_g1_i1.p1 TRINITY_DN3207_c0_g1~~TRINITY_DN3207_c0_g1_i1.p1  ORF type:complete len:604 (-),score=94.97 TRINITY_DN3207_c0_g1_i1:426-2237(-)
MFASRQKNLMYRMSFMVVLTTALLVVTTVATDDCESDSCDVGSLMQMHTVDPVSKGLASQPSAVSREAKADASQMRPGALTAKGSIGDRVLASWFEVAQLWRLGHRSLSKHTSNDLSQKPEDAKLFQQAAEIGYHHPTDLAWLTMIPCIIIGFALAGIVINVVSSRSPGSGGEDKKAEAQPLAERGEATKKMTAVQMLFNMVQNIVGEGMLSLPAGIAGGTGLLAGSLIAFFFCSLMGYTFAIMGRTCYATGEKTHKDCAAKVSGPGLAQTMAVVLMLKTVFTCLTYAIVIGESFSRIMQFFGVAGIMGTSQGTLITICVFVLIPLCLQRDLSALSYTSMVGCFGQVWVVLSMHIRYHDGSYRPGGQFYDAISEADKPDFSGGVMYWKTSAATFVLLGSLATAFIAHYNAPKFYSQLEDATPEKFTKVVMGAFGFAMVIYFWIMSVGYLTFGKASEGLILNNYSEKDSLITAARIAMGFAVTFGFPLGFTGLRDATMSVFDMAQDKFVPVTLGLLSVIITGACFFHDLGLANSLGGAIFGALITLVFPGLLLYFTGYHQGVTEFSDRERKYGSAGILALGFSLMAFGSTLVIITRYFPEVLGK